MRNKQKKKKEKLETPVITPEIVEEVQHELVEAINTNLEYSLEVDPEDKYGMSDEQKTFIKNYIEFKSILGAAEFSGISPEQAKMFFVSYSTQQEIRRINKALYHRQFANKLLTLDDIGGYLSSVLTDDVPLADQLPQREKLKVAQMLIDLNTLKLEALNNNPQKLMNKDLDIQLKELSVETIKNLLSTTENMKEKRDAINQFNDKLSIEEKTYLESLPTKELLEILNNKKGD